MKKKHEQFRNAGARLVTISTDSSEELETYRRRSNVPFTMLSDAERSVIEEYGVHNASERGGVAVPAIFIIDRSGEVQYAHVQRTLVRVRNKKLLEKLGNLGTQ